MIEKSSNALTEQETQKSVTDYLDSLAWDGVPRLDRWLIDYAGAEDTSNVRGASRAILVAAVRRARQPGCKFDQLLVICGPQGCGKSQALQLLAVNDAWFTDALTFVDAADKQVVELIAGKWIVEAGELEGLIQKDAAALKAFLARLVDEARLAYQRDRTRVPRGFVVVGTTSAPDYLMDTGSRRYWPVTVRSFDLARLAEVRDQLWAEASVAEAAGASIDLAPAA